MPWYFHWPVIVKMYFSMRVTRTFQTQPLVGREVLLHLVCSLKPRSQAVLNDREDILVREHCELWLDEHHEKGVGYVTAAEKFDSLGHRPVGA